MTAPRTHSAAVAAVEAAIRARTGLVLEGPRREDLSRSLDKAMGETDPAEWTARLETDAAAFNQVMDDVTIGETYFFRDPAHFAFLRETFLPAFRRRAARNVRAWSAGCSSGEEPYSLAIMFDSAGVGADILGTDISRAALAKAKAGVYGRWSLRGEAENLVGAALRPVVKARRESFEISDRIKRRVRFAQINLAKSGDLSMVSAGSMDVIFCRNVLIYLEPEVIRRVARRFFDTLSEGGVLLTGPSDPLLNEAAPFKCDFTPHGVVYSKTTQAQTETPAIVPFEAAPVTVVPEPDKPEPALLPQRDGRADLDAAFARGEHDRVLLLARSLPGDAGATLLAIRARANMGQSEQAAAQAARAAKEHPTSREIPYLQAILLMNLGRLDEADAVLKRMIYLDPSLAVAHFTSGNLRLRMGDLAGARRAFTAAHKAAAARPANEVLALSEGETAGQLASAAERLARKGTS